MRIQKQLQKGFILFITLMMLIIFAILGIGLYQQTTTSTLNVQYVTFKQEAEDLAIQALNELEANLITAAGGLPKYSKRDICGAFAKDANGDPIKDSEGNNVLANRAENCDPISDETIDEALTELRETGGLTGSTANKPGWDNLIQQGFKGTFSGDGSVFFIVQQLGLGKCTGDDKLSCKYLHFRITIIARVLDAYSVISAVSAVPEK